MNGDEFVGTILGNGSAPEYVEKMLNGLECAVTVICNPGTSKTAFTKVELTNAPTPIVGKTPSECNTIPTLSTVPANAGEILPDSIKWYTYPGNQKVTGEFEPGRSYYSEICIKLNDGYKIPFDKNWNFIGTTVIDGEEDYMYSEPNSTADCLYIGKVYKTDGDPVLTPITKIDIKIAAPVAGKTADPTPIVVTEPAGAVSVMEAESESLRPEWRDMNYNISSQVYLKRM